MRIEPTFNIFKFFLVALSLGASFSISSQPSQTPLLVGRAGAKPNIMLTLDNSSSMAYPFHESYNVRSNNRGGDWEAQRSSEVNPVYYNPRTTYLARVDKDGAAMAVSDGVVFVDNSQSVNYKYTLYRDSRTKKFVRQSTHKPVDITNGYEVVGGETSKIDLMVPVHSPVTRDTPRSERLPTFSWYVCESVVKVGGLESSCSRWSGVTITYGSNKDVTIPADHSRTDCSGRVCSYQQEVNNIINWYRYYSTRMDLAATSLGQVLSNKSYTSQFRLGYFPINNEGQVNNQLQLQYDEDVSVMRPFRLYRSDADFYNWLYQIPPWGSTPIHPSVESVASYIKDENLTALAVDPMKKRERGNTDSACRRSFNLIFSDGAWSKNTSTNPDEQSTTMPGPIFERTLPNGQKEQFGYLMSGFDSSFEKRQMYTPYPGSHRGGLADLTAKHYWLEDFRPRLENKIIPKLGQPTFWQNLTTYTIGFYVYPSGEYDGNAGGLSFSQINNYAANYLQFGLTGIQKPSWPRINLPNEGRDADRIDDFIHAGFTGGGKGLSVSNSSEIRNTFTSIISDIVNVSGNDSGVGLAVSGGSANIGFVKFGSNYRTTDNSGEIYADKLDKDGVVSQRLWSASDVLSEPGSRQIFGIAGNNYRYWLSSIDGQARQSLISLATGWLSTELGSSNDWTWLARYIRGEQHVRSPSGRLLRPRLFKFGAIVNAPPLYMGADLDLGYDLFGNVSGSKDYLNFVSRKSEFPSTLFVASNSGLIHNFDAQTGKEIAAFLPSGAYGKLANYLSPDYNFEYIMDGPLSENDVYFDEYSSFPGWNSLVIGTGGRGVKSIFGIRSPLNDAFNGSKNRNPKVTDFLWEFDGSKMDSANVGYITTPVRTGQLPDPAGSGFSGKWVAISGTGHFNNNAKKHGLILISAEDGTLQKKIEIPSTFSVGRGVGGVALIRDADRRVIGAYAGDDGGNLWRFNIVKSRPNQSDAQLIFTVPSKRSIYGAPAWQPHPLGGNIVVFGTGIALEDNDLSQQLSTPNNYIYGVWDKSAITDIQPTITDADLLTQSILPRSAALNALDKTGVFSQVTNNKIDWSRHLGWKFRLGWNGVAGLGERSIDQVRNVGSSVLITTVVLGPDLLNTTEKCVASNEPQNYIYVLNAENGGGGKSIDINGDGRLDDVSVVFIQQGGFTRGTGIVEKTTSRIVRASQGVAGESLSRANGSRRSRCISTKFQLFGTKSGSINAGVTCSNTWSSQSYQLLSPPRL